MLEGHPNLVSRGKFKSEISCLCLAVALALTADTNQ